VFARGVVPERSDVLGSAGRYADSAKGGGVSAETFATEMTVYATVIVNDREPLERITGPGGDEWRSQFYALETDAEVVEHFVYNAVVNGVHDITRLDGWADCDPDAIKVEIDDTSFSTWKPA
jgi:hypothetical protein